MNLGLNNARLCHSICFKVCLKPEIPIPTDLESYFKQLVVPLDLMNKFRIYLTCARLADYELSDSMMMFLYKDTLYKQIDGVAMENSLRPTLANFFSTS